jgi:hypothetical protein
VPSPDEGLVTIESADRRTLSPQEALDVLAQLKSRLEADRDMQLSLSWQLLRRKPQ